MQTPSQNEEPFEEKEFRVEQGQSLGVDSMSKDRDRLQEYSEFFEGLEERYTKDGLIDKMRQNGIKYEPQRRGTAFEMQLIHSNKTGFALTIEVEMGPITHQITLFQNDFISPSHELDCQTSAFSTVYTYVNCKSSAIIKCISFHQDKFVDGLILAVKEYTFLKVAAALDVGPQLVKVLGFDLIAHAECIEFAMEKCQTMQNSEKQSTLANDESTRRILMEKLLRLHRLRIVHLDIKPDNICFNRRIGEPIFIDFGFTEIIDEVPGENTLTSFIGSLNYCSDDMRDIYVNKKPGTVDLYHNDVSCLKKVYNDLKESEEVRARLNILYARSQQPPQSRTIDTISTIQKSSQRVTQNYKFLQVLYNLYNETALSTWYDELQEFMMGYKEKILKFLETLTYSQQLQNFCNKLLSKNKMDPIIFYNYLSQFKSFLFKGRAPPSPKKQLFDEKEEFINLEIERKNRRVQAEHFTRMRFKTLLKGLRVSHTDLTRKSFVQGDDIRALVDAGPSMRKIGRDLFFRQFMRTTDLRSNYNLDDKLKLAISFANTAGLVCDNTKTKQLVICWRFILQKVLSTRCDYLLQILPPLVHNLTITQFLKIQQIPIIFKYILLSQNQPIRKCQIIYMCSSASLWVINRYITNYITGDYYRILSDQIMLFLQNLSNSLSEQFYSFMEQIFSLIKLVSPFSNSKKDNLLSNLNGFKSVLDHQVYMDIRINYITSTFIYRETGQGVQKKKFQDFVKYQQFLKNRFVFNYYDFRLLTYVSKTQDADSIVKMLKALRKAMGVDDIYQNFIISHLYLKISPSAYDKIKRKYYEHIIQSLKRKEISNIENVVVLLEQHIINFPNADEEEKMLQKKLSLILTADFILNIDLNQQNGEQKPHLGCIQTTKLYSVYPYLCIYYWRFNKSEQNSRKNCEMIIKKMKDSWQNIHCQLCVSRIYQKMVRAQALQIINRFLFRLYKRQPNPEQKSIKHVECLFFQDIFSDKAHKIEIAAHMILKIQQCWIILFQIPRNINIYEALLKYLLIEKRNIRQFIMFQRSILENVGDEHFFAYFEKLFSTINRLAMPYCQEFKMVGRRLRQMHKDQIKFCLKYKQSSLMLYFIAVEPLYDEDQMRVLHLSCSILMRVKASIKESLQNIIYYHTVLRGYDPHKKKEGLLSFNVQTICNMIKNTRKSRFFMKKIIKASGLIKKSVLTTFLIPRSFRNSNCYRNLQRNLVRMNMAAQIRLDLRPYIREELED